MARDEKVSQSSTPDPVGSLPRRPETERNDGAERLRDEANLVVCIHMHNDALIITN